MLAIGLLLTFTSMGMTSSTQQEKTLLLEYRKGEYNLGSYLDVLEDPTGSWTIKDVSSPPLSQRFRPNHSTSLNLGLSKSVYWFRFRIELPNDASKGEFVSPWLFYMGRTLDYYEGIDLYWPNSPGEPRVAKSRWLTKPYGRHQAIATDKRQPLCAQLPLPPDGAKAMTYYLRVEMNDTLFMTPVLYSPQGFADFSRRESLFYGVYYGVVLAMLFYNLFLFISLREKVRLLFIVYTTILGFYFFLVNEISLNVMPVAFFKVSREVAMMLAMISVAGIVVFVQEFLETKRTLPKTHRVLQLLTASALLSALGVVFVPFELIHRIITLMGVAGSVIVTWAGIASLVSGYRPARFFLVAWPFFTVGGLMYALTFQGVFPFSKIGYHAFQIGSGIEVVLLSFAIADRMKILREQLGQEQSRRQEQLKRFAQKLERSEEKERRRIAEILHDSIGQKLFAAKWNVEKLFGRLMAGPSKDNAALTNIEDCIAETRSLTNELYPRELYEFGLNAAMGRLAADYARRFDLNVDFRPLFEPIEPNGDLAITLYRSVAELMNNVVKHANATRVTISINHDSGGLIVSVKDNGAGFGHSPEKTLKDTGFGLFSIQERLLNIGGEMMIAQPVQGGSEVTLVVPLKKQHLGD